MGSSSPPQATANSAILSITIIEPKNWVVRLLVSSIDLYYDGDAKLVRYQGFSNLKPPAGQSREVQIDFRHYESEQSLDSPLAEWLPGATRG